MGELCRREKSSFHRALPKLLVDLIVAKLGVVTIIHTQLLYPLTFHPQPPKLLYKGVTSLPYSQRQKQNHGLLNPSPASDPRALVAPVLMNSGEV